MLTLNPLPRRQGAEIVAYVTGGKALPKEISDQIVDRTDGVPLFIEELTKTVVESDILTEIADRCADTEPAAPLVIPTTLHASLLARLDRLVPARGVAQIGAALGRQFSHELISAIEAMPQHQLDDGLAQLVRAEMIFRRGTPPDAEYTFKHALVQDVAYGTLLRGRRLQLHGCITTTLEAQFPEIVETKPEVLARHCTEAGLLEKAVGYRLKAGKQGIARSAMAEAVAQLRKGLDLLSGVPGSTASQELELDLRIALGHALVATKGYSASELGEIYARARQICEQLDQPPQLGAVLHGQWAFRLVRGELDQAGRHAEELRHVGEARNRKAAGYSASGNVCLYLGKFLDSRAYYESWLPLWHPMHRGFTAAPEDPYVGALIHFSRTLLCLGYIDQACFRRNEALAEARRLSPFNLAFALFQAWYGDWALEGVKSAQTLLRSAEEVLVISGEQGFSEWFGIGNIMRGWCLAAVGQVAEGIPLLLQGLATYRGTGAKLGYPFALMTLAEVHGMAAQPEEGLDRLDEAAKLIDTTQERWSEAEMHRLRGTLLLSMREPTAAEDSFRRALAVARRQSARFWELRAATSLARLWRDQGKRVEARELIAPVYCWFTEGFATRDLKEAKVLLDELSS